MEYMRLLYVVGFMLLMPVMVSGQVLYKQDFGGNKVTDDSILQKRFKACKYHQIFTNEDGSEVGTFSIRKRAYYNGKRVNVGKMKATNSQWYAQDDHTYPNDYTRGYFLQVDGSLEYDIFYSIRVRDVKPGSTIEFSLWAVNLYTPYQRFVWEERHSKVTLPDVDLLVVSSPELDYDWRDSLRNKVASFRIGPIPYDTLDGKEDYKKSATWRKYKFQFVVPEGVTSLYFLFGNRAANSPGDDFGLDDIVIKYVGKKE